MSKRPRRSKVPFDDLPAIRNILRGNTNRLRPVFSDIRREVAPSIYPNLIKDIYLNPFYQQTLFGTPFPRSIAQIKRLQPLNSAGLDRDLLWTTALLCEHSPIISSALALKKSLTQSLLNGDSASALELIESKDPELGACLWTEELRIFLTSESLGPEKRQELINTYYTVNGISGFTYYMLYYYGFRADEGASLSQIRGLLDPLSNIQVYLRYKLIPFDLSNFGSKQQLEGLIRYESNSSLLDLYDTTCRVLQLIVAVPDLLKTYCDVVLRCASALAVKIPDHKTRLISSLLDVEADIPYEDRSRVYEGGFRLCGRGKG
jgi:hypothetical protein